MAGIAVVLSLLVAALGALGMASPTRLLDLVRRFQSQAGLFTAAAFRVVMGTVLFLAAPASRAPTMVRILGVFIVVAGLVTPMVGVERARRLIAWWSARGPTFMRLWAAVALAFGLLLAYVVAPSLWSR